MSITKLFIDHAGCTRCSKCIWVCPVRALSLQEKSTRSLVGSGVGD